MAGIANYDYDAESAEIQRRQRIADAMQSGALAPIQMPTTPGAKVSPLAAIVPMIQALMANKMQANAKQSRTALAERYNNDLTTGMQKYFQTANPSERQVNNQGPMPDGSALEGTHPETVPGDPKRAIAEALASNHPVLREFALKQMAEQQKAAVTPKDLLPYAAPGSILSNPNDPSTWAPKENLGTVGEVVYDKDKREIVPLAGPTPVQKTLNGDLYEQSPSTGQWKKLDNAPKVNVHTSVNPTIAGQKAGMEAYWKHAATKVDALGQVASQAQNNMQTLAELKALDAKGIFSNVSTGPATFLSNLGQSVGVKVDTNKLGNTETYNALATDLWQGLVSKYGGNRGVTKEEATEIKKMLPLAANSPQARQQLFSILENVSSRQIAQYNNANQSFARAAKLDDPEAFAKEFQDVYTPAPQAPSPVTQPGAPAKPTVSNW